ncbi:MAG: type II toxin-antitoxin system RelE/ParE family toxin [Bacteroidetes bacterium]|nr:type II toxin-antitoxin system RelE/ParE family toxin [Bacteroidota bacterium]
MNVKYKPKFRKDLGKIKDKETHKAIYRALKNIEKANHGSQINNIKKLKNYETLYRIRITIDAKRDYRMVIRIKNNNVLLLRFLPRKKVYSQKPY